MSNKKRIALDMDEVIADVIPKFLDLYETEFGQRLTTNDFRGRKIYDTPAAYKIRNHLFDKGFFRDLPLMANSQEVVRWLHDYYDIYIITAATEFKNSLEDKYEWLEEHFSFIPWQRYIFCGDKSFMKADYMIDDKASHLAKFDGKGLLFSASHNVESTGDFTRMNSWLEIKAFFEEELKKDGIVV